MDSGESGWHCRVSNCGIAILDRTRSGKCSWGERRRCLCVVRHGCPGSGCICHQKSDLAGGLAQKPHFKQAHVCRIWRSDSCMLDRSLPVRQSASRHLNDRNRVVGRRSGVYSLERIGVQCSAIGSLTPKASLTPTACNIGFRLLRSTGACGAPLFESCIAGEDGDGRVAVARVWHRRRVSGARMPR
jgi:hypothetical protein